MPSGSVTIRVPACAPCCGVQPGGGECTAPTVGTVTCASRTGSGNLRGASKFQNHNSGDWNLRKFTRVDMTPTASQTIRRYRYTYPGGPTSAPCPGVPTIWTYRAFDGTVGLWDVSTNALLSGWSVKSFSLCAFETTTLISNGFVTNPTGGSAGFFAWGPTAATPTVISDIQRSYGPSNAQAIDTSCTTLACDGILDFSGDGDQAGDILIYQDLSIPDSVQAALARGTSTTGTLCRTTAGTIGSTSAGSTAQIAISATDSVQATIPLSGLVIGEAYELDILVNRYTAGGGGFVDQITVTVSFTAEATSENYVYDVPVNTDFDYEFDSVDDARCAA